MLKIVCMIRPEPPLIYFVNKINESHRVALAVVEYPPDRESLTAKMKAKGLTGTIYSLRKKMSKRQRDRESDNIHSEYFGNRWRAIGENIPILEVDDINANVVLERLQKEKPDLLLDHGTSLVKNHILETAELALNLHWGLSPYYRGTYCTEWALVNWDPYNIGVTIHKLTKIIDGGSILAQERAVIKSSDTAHSINMQLTKLGTDLVISAIDRMEKGEQLHFQKQDYSAGHLTRNRQWSDYIRMQIEFIEKYSLVDVMLKKPSRKQKLPIIEF